MLTPDETVGWGELREPQHPTAQPARLRIIAESTRSGDLELTRNLGILPRSGFVQQPERRLSYQLPFWISRLGAGLCGNTQAELAPTRYRDGSQNMRVLPSQGCLPKPQAVALSEWCSLVGFDRTAIAGRVRLRDKPCKAGIRADPL